MVEYAPGTLHLGPMGEGPVVVFLLGDHEPKLRDTLEGLAADGKPLVIDHRNHLRRLLDRARPVRVRRPCAAHQQACVLHSARPTSCGTADTVGNSARSNPGTEVVLSFQQWLRARSPAVRAVPPHPKRKRHRLRAIRRNRHIGRKDPQNPLRYRRRWATHHHPAATLP